MNSVLLQSLNSNQLNYGLRNMQLANSYPDLTAERLRDALRIHFAIGEWWVSVNSHCEISGCRTNDHTICVELVP